MTRLGWGLLALFLLAGAAFASMLSVGSAPRSAAAPAAHTASAPASPKRSPDIADRADPALLTLPVAGVARSAIADTWGQARSEGRVHHGTDIPAAAGTSVLAAGAGTVEKLFQSRLGGVTLYLRSLDRRWTYYYAHLSGYASGIHEGQMVSPGVPLGFVGDTGDAGAGNYHLHFGLTRTRPDQHWYEGEDVNPFPMLTGRR